MNGRDNERLVNDDAERVAAKPSPLAGPTKEDEAAFRAQPPEEADDTRKRCQAAPCRKSHPCVDSSSISSCRFAPPVSLVAASFWTLLFSL
jgi:hypothetical protein